MENQQHRASPAYRPFLPRARSLGRLAYAVPILLALGVDAPRAETATMQGRFAEFRSRVDETAHALVREAPFKGLSPRERSAGIDFLVGNMLFVATHEMGHAAIAELDLPVLGREE